MKEKLLREQLYATPSTIDEALQIASGLKGEYAFIAGGTDLQPARQLRLAVPSNTIDLTGISELRDLRVKGNQLNLGSLVTLDQLTNSPELAQNCPLLAAAAKVIATPVIRKTATVGGNLLVSNRCTHYNQSELWRTSAGSCLRDVGDTCLVTGARNGKCVSRNVSDLAPALIVLNAEAVIRNPREEFSIPLRDLFFQDGLQPIRHLLPDGILLKLQISLNVKSWYYRKLRLRRSLDFTSLTVAGVRDDTGTIRICLNGVATAPVLISGRESELSLKDVQSAARLKSKLVDNDLLPLHYRKEMMKVYLDELWGELTQH